MGWVVSMEELRVRDIIFITGRIWQPAFVSRLGVRSGGEVYKAISLILQNGILEKLRTLIL